MLFMLRLYVVVGIMCCMELLLQSTACGSMTVTATANNKLFLMSAVHSANIFKSSVQRWDIGDELKQQVSENMNGEILFAAALQVDESDASQWGSGLGSLAINVKALSHAARNDLEGDVEESNHGVFALMCIYMSVSGADGRFNVSSA